MDAYLTGLFAQPAGIGVSLGEFVLRLLVAFLVGQAIGWTYSRSHGALSYSQNFVQSLVLLSMVVSVIMCVVGDSLARAFGLGAALAIVRFRTPVKDTRDTVFLFLSVAVGMAAGAGQLGIAIAASFLIGGISLYLSWSSYGMRSQMQGMLRFRFSGTSGERDSMVSILEAHCQSFSLSGVRSSGADAADELVYDVDLKEAEAGARLVEDLANTGKVSGITLLPQARAGEG